MFVPAPPLKGNGDVIVRKQGVTNAYDQGGFDSVGAALSYSRNDLNFSPSSEGNRRIRRYMSSGRIAPGVFKPTKYYSVSYLLDYSKGSKVVIRNHNGSNPDTFTVRYRDVAHGYIGGFSTGWGNPWDFFIYGFNSGHAAAIGNRAIVDQLDLRARTEIMLRARNQKFDVPESLAGLPQTVLMVAKKVSQVVSAWKSIRNGNWALALRHLGLNPFSPHKGKTWVKNASASEQWLALVYGWLPLLNDISDGVNLVNSALTGDLVKDGIFSVKRNVKGYLPFSNWLLNPSDDPWKNPQVSHEVVASISYKYRLKVKDQLAAYLLTLGLDNPAYSVWVSTPWSFVIDWLTPIGDWLQALSAPIALQFVSGYRTRNISGWCKMKAGPFAIDASHPDCAYYSGPAETTLRLVEMDREALFDFPQVLPYFRIPFNSPTRLVNAIALLNTAKQHKGRV